MNVCIDIYSLNNRGDWLMFEAALEQVRKRFPNDGRAGSPSRLKGSLRGYREISFREEADSGEGAESFQEARGVRPVCRWIRLLNY